MHLQDVTQAPPNVQLCLVQHETTLKEGEHEKKPWREREQKGGKFEKQPVGESDNRLLTLPVDQVWVGDHPGFQHTPELDVTLRRGQQLIILVAAGDVHLNL